MSFDRTAELERGKKGRESRAFSRPVRAFGKRVEKSCRLLLLGLLCAPTLAWGAALQIQITPSVGGESLQAGSLRYRNSAGETFSITRLSYLLSDFALQRADGFWLELSNSVAWLDYEQNRNSLRLESIPPGPYRAVRFLAGLGGALNHSEPAKFPAGHPLNPNFNGLHWSWQGGYIFLALEGLWRNPAGQYDGWAYHLARDTNAVRVTIAASLEVSRETQLELDFDLLALLSTPNPLSFATDGSSTHSRDGDSVAAALVRNLPGAFRARGVRQLSEAQIAAANLQPLFLPKWFTAYPFQMGASFPIPDLPRDNPLTAERVELGRRLFLEKRLSINDSQSCADCHTLAKAFTDARRVSIGAEGQSGVRHAMPLFNLAWKRSFFWDGRATSLREQVLQPIQNPLEMHETLTDVVRKLAGDYPKLFEAAFGSPEITAQKISLALENYLLTITSFDSKFDRALRGEEKLTSEEKRGFELFSTEYDPRRGQFGGDCFHCHGGPLFQSQAFANNGLDEHFKDPGRAQVTGNARDEGKFAVPSLRNVALTGPYMHDGRFETLDGVVEHYASGIRRSATLDPNLAKHPDGGVPLSTSDKRALVAFLKTLTDERFITDAGRQEITKNP